ncbi:MAG: O-antigen ligase family protein [Flavobacteriales bacterium]|nr:O-antigen ligase family protein [Flavobacteriales bacterium]MBK6945752.1 O-antigen ligase family protein [Flavobacteriales bacterium]MBK7241852.1 O-antigen ligase family protein [Flavobacteriales bacterium]MBK9534697.1 O-antigen ligase family protein [Flavobacteriales bacterium]MBP9138266.1 O-antigen ligase family protein [Flavobacteriales bacterium]
MALFKRINSTNLSSSDRSIWLLLVVTAFSIPLSLKLYSTERDLEVIFPAELLVGLTALYVIIRWVVSQRARSALDMQALKHPIVILIALDLMISVVSYWGSDEPMVSLKWLVVRTSYVLVFFLVPLLIREFNKEKLVKLLTYHAWALILVVIWVFKAAFEQGFDRNVANYSCMPFYNDHTIYAAALVFSLFTFLISVFSRKEEGASLFGGAVTVVLVSVVVIALVLSYTRAAWLSVVVVVILGVVLLIRPRPAVWLGCTLIIMLVAIFSWRPLQKAALEHKGDADADNAGISEVLWSYANISTDASNRERLVRWSSAYSIFLADPFLGCGPGMFKFKYPLYQDPEHASFRTVPQPTSAYISRVWEPTSDLIVRDNPQNLYVDPGTAHSEYLLALSERGPVALSLFIGIFVAMVLRYVDRIREMTDRSAMIQFLLVVLAILAYGVHGFFNNYLDDCKIAFPLYFFLVLFIRMDQHQFGKNVPAGGQLP